MSNTKIDMDMPFAEFAEKHLKTATVSNSALIDLLSAEPTVERAAKALFDSKSHPMLESGGHPTIWEKLPRVARKGYRKQVRIVVDAILSR